jgi:hypothetical protein
MKLCAGILRCISLTYSSFEVSLLDQKEVSNFYRFIDNLRPGLLNQSKGESEI